MINVVYRVVSWFDTRDSITYQKMEDFIMSNVVKGQKGFTLIEIIAVL
ncbi:MAG: prepilin-type N-terminal cleavage/methylation domain-containing protein, partial [Deltaproteobacteria bacterium]|nr:prepilin-type N-terminal cleavage/methylation domain-containing protein [Deltaproteobacteria bacterium]